MRRPRYTMIGLVAAATLSVACADAQEIPRSLRGSVTQDVAGMQRLLG